MNAYTNMAIWQFKKVIQKENQLEKARQGLENLVVKLPKEDFNQYFEITEQIRAKFEE